jgi:hypothetical protein
VLEVRVSVEPATSRVALAGELIDAQVGMLEFCAEPFEGGPADLFPLLPQQLFLLGPAADVFAPCASYAP